MAITVLSLIQHVLLAIIVTVGFITAILAAIYAGVLTQDYLMICIVTYIVGNSAHAMSVAYSAGGLSVTAQRPTSGATPPPSTGA